MENWSSANSSSKNHFFGHCISVGRFVANLKLLLLEIG